MKQSRRQFLKHSGLAAGAGMFMLYSGCNSQSGSAEEQAATAETAAAGTMFFKISLAQWSLHRTIFEKKELDNLDFASTARNKYGIEAVEYVNQFFKDKAKDAAYLAEMNKRAADNGITQLLIMVDGEGGLAETDSKQLAQSVENHYKWVDAAKTLGCHSIRVNAFSSNPNAAEAAKAAVEGLSKLGEYGQKVGINVIVENHGGFSSDGKWLSGVMKTVNMPNVGTLPDFGNFCVRRDNKTANPWEGACVEEYDRYLGVQELMPFAKGVSAKSNVFDEAGNEVQTDFMRMLQVVKDAGYRGYVGIEYEGEISEDEGIKKTKVLLERVGAALGS